MIPDDDLLDFWTDRPGASDEPYAPVAEKPPAPRPLRIDTTQPDHGIYLASMAKEHV
jgi:hypothetical protein